MIIPVKDTNILFILLKLNILVLVKVLSFPQFVLKVIWKYINNQFIETNVPGTLNEAIICFLVVFESHYQSKNKNTIYIETKELS